MLAHVNNSGLHVGIWLVGPDSGIGWGSSPDFPYQEAAYFGNLFAQNMPGNYCTGKNMGAGDSKGRLGSPFGNNSAIMNAPYGWQWDGASQQNVPSYCVNPLNASPGCIAQNEGFSSCADPSPQLPYTAGHVWHHPVTVYRNFESTMLYKICNKNGGGQVPGRRRRQHGQRRERRAARVHRRGGSDLEDHCRSRRVPTRSSTRRAACPSTSTARRSSRSRTRARRSRSRISTDQPGFANLRLATNTSAVFWNNWSTSDGILIQTINGQYTADSGEVDFTAVGPDRDRPGHAHTAWRRSTRPPR